MPSPIFLERFDDMPWRSSREFASIAKEGQFHTGNVQESYYEQWKFKVLRTDERTQGQTRVFMHTPGWEEPNFGYHLVTEEAFRIYGEGKIPDESFSGGIQYNITRGGCYTWRPPGWVHDGNTLTDSMGLIINDGQATHIIAKESQVGKNALHPDDLEKAIGPRGYIRRMDTNLIPWIPNTVAPRIKDASNSSYLGRSLQHKLLSLDPSSGAQSLLVKFSQEFERSATHSLESEIQFFVLSGSVTIDGKKINKHGYVYLPSGHSVRGITSEEGCVCFFKSEGPISI